MLSQELRQELEKLPVILSITDVANALSVSAITVYRMILENQLPAYKEGREWNILRSDLIKHCSRKSNL